MARDSARSFQAGEPEALEIGADAPVPLAPGPNAWTVAGGTAEIYLQTPAFRQLLTVVPAGSQVFALAEGSRADLLATGPEGTTLTRAEGEEESLVAGARRWLEATAKLLPDGADLAEALVVLAREGRLTVELAEHNARLPQRLEELRRERERADLDRLAGRRGPRDEDGEPRRRAAAEAVMTLARSLGLEARSPLKVKQGDFAELPLVLRQVGLRARKVRLGDSWWRHDLGPLIALDEASGQALALLRRRGHYEAWGETRGETGDAGGPPLRVTAETARRIGPAYAVHPPLPAEVTGFLSLARHLLPSVAKDGVWAIAAGAGMGLAGVLVPMATGWILSDIVPGRLMGLLVAVGLALVAAALFSLLFSAARGLALQRMAGRTGIDVTAALADKILRLPPGFFRDYAAGDLNQRIEAVDEMRVLITTVMISALITLAFSFFYFGLLLFYDLRLALLSVALVLVYIAAVSIARLVQRPHLRRAAKQEGETAGATYEALSGIAKLRVAAAEERILERWLARYGAELRSYGRMERIAARFEAFSDAYETITLLILFAAAALLTSQDLPAGLFIGFLVAFGAFQGAFTGFCDSLMSVFAASPMAERARPILTTPGEATEGRADPGRLSGAIEVSGLTFAYGEGRPVLDGLSLTVRPGEQVAVVGASGSGKSTLFRLLLGFETPTSGSITYDGQDLAKLNLSAVRGQIGVVMQSSRLFAGSIQENIAGASDAGLGDCMAAAEMAGLAPDLERLPMGLHTPIVEGAATLSGGQKQRILIARALAARPGILFLDEATSALDNATQARVTAALDGLGVTRIVVAHRLTTVRNADRICVLERGRIVESGTFEELMALDGAFAALARRQLTQE